MPISFDFPQGRLEPREPRVPKLRRRLIVILIVIAAIVFGGKAALSYWVDLLWFRSLGYSDVFWTTWRLEWGVFAIFSIATFVLLYGAFLALKRASQASLPSDRQIIFGGQPVNLSIEPVLRIVGIVGSLAAAVLSGTAMMQEWPTLALFWFAPHATGSIADPIFGRPLNFFLFTLPAWQLILGWLLTLAVIVCVVAVALIALAGGFSLLDKRAAGHSAPAWRGLSITVAFLLIVVAMNVYVSRFESLLDHHTIFEGVNYTDAHVTLAGLLIVCAALISRRGHRAGQRGARRAGDCSSPPWFPPPPAISLLSVVGWYVTNFIVKPNELVREKPYIANNIEMTQQAYGLDQFQQREFPAETTVDAADPANNQPTLQNIRLWDWHALQDTLRQVQEIRTYYDFPDIDIDRYSIDGTMREVMLADARAERGQAAGEQPQLDQREAGLHPRLRHHHEPGQRLHVRGPAHAAAEQHAGAEHGEGPERDAPGDLLRRADRYRCLRQDAPAGVRLSRRARPTASPPTRARGGIALGGFLRRVLLAFDRDDLAKLPFSDDVNAAEPPADAAQRARARRHPGALPHLRPGPLHRARRRWPALLDHGRLHHLGQLSLLRATTTWATTPINYMRNSVKAVDRRLRRHHHLLRLRLRRPDPRGLPAHLPQPLQGRLGRCPPTCASTCATRSNCSSCRPRSTASTT